VATACSIDLSMMRVCSPQLGLDPEANLGGAVYDRELLKAMVSLGASVDVLIPEEAPVDERVGWHLTRTARHRRSYYEYNWIFLEALRRHWAHRPADILRVHSPYAVGPGALIFAREAGVPIVLHYLHREPRWLWVLADRWTLPRYDLVITISEATRRDLLAYGLPPERVVVAYPGVEERYAPSYSRPDGQGPILALYVGGLLKRKNLPLALRGLAQARARGVDVEMVIAGTGDEESTLRSEAERLLLGSSVRFLGRVDEATKLDLLRRADLFLFPSVLEGFGMAAAEALACGIPVIGIRTTSTAEIVRDGESGLLLTDPVDVQGMALAIERLADSRETRRRMGAAGRADVRARFSWTRSAAEVLDAYEAVANRRRQR
jgi:glycosyltransferase involved in cell wall biosynthesis